MRLLLAVFLLSVTTWTIMIVALGCASAPVKGAERAAEAAFDCAKADLYAVLEQDGLPLLTKVAGALANGSTGGAEDAAIAELTSLESKAGPAALACATKAAVAVFQAKGNARAMEGGGASRDLNAAELGKKFITARGYRFR